MPCLAVTTRNLAPILSLQLQFDVLYHSAYGDSFLPHGGGHWTLVVRYNLLLHARRLFVVSRTYHLFLVTGDPADRLEAL